MCEIPRISESELAPRHSGSSQPITLSFPLRPVETTLSPRRRLHHPFCMRTMSPVATSSICSSQRTRPTTPDSSRPQAAATLPVHFRLETSLGGYLRKTRISNSETGLFSFKRLTFTLRRGLRPAPRCLPPIFESFSICLSISFIAAIVIDVTRYLRISIER